MDSNSGFMFDKKDSRDFMITRDTCLMKSGELPEKLDLSTRFTPVEDQGQLGSCTAQAVVGLCEYLTNTSKDTFIDLSRLFLYKITRNLMGYTGDTGASIRACMRACNLMGICPEAFYKYDIENFDEEPGAFQYALASNYKISNYYRLAEDEYLVETIKDMLRDSNPVVCGVKVFSDYFKANGNVYFPEDPDNSSSSGWHAIILVGYDNTKKMFKFRNSWGSDWGVLGYGWISYDYFLNNTHHTSSDHWICKNADFIDIADVL